MMSRPVAWRFHFPTGLRWHYTEHGPNQHSRLGLTWEPLYGQDALSTKRNRAAIDELVLALKAYQQAGFGNSTDFVQQKIAAHMARSAITKHTQPKEQA